MSLLTEKRGWEAPSDTCCCRSHDAQDCYDLRYDLWRDPEEQRDRDERCQCGCHDGAGYDEDEP